MSYSSEHELLVREFEQWYRTVPSDVSPIIADLNAQQGKGAFERKCALYRAAQQLDVKVFRHFPFFFELNAGHSRVQRPEEGLSGYMLSGMEPGEKYIKLRERLMRLDLALLPENPFVMNLECGAARVTEQGTAELRRQVHRAAEKALARRRRDFCSAAIVALDCADGLCRKFADAARHMAQYEIDPGIRRNLERMAEFDITQGAVTLFDAMQGMLYWRELVQSLEGANYPGWGCLDDALARYYDADVAEGRIDPDEARGLLRCFMSYHALRNEKARMSITLGRRPSALTLLMMSTLDDELLAVNDVYVYSGSDDSEEYRAEVLRLMCRGVTVLSRDMLGGRIEMVAGQAQRCAEETRLADVVINLPAVLMGTLLPQTVERWQGLSIDCYDGDFFAAEDIYRHFMDNLAALEQDVVTTLMGLLEQRPQHNPMLLQSVSMPDCIARSRDVTECGALSTSIVIGFDGLGVFLRSMATIKQLCYDTRRVPMCKIISTLRANFEGDEPLYRLMSAPKPELENELLEKFLNNVDELFMAVSERPEISVRPSLLQESRMGAGLMATPDGRFYGEGLESDMLPARGNRMGGAVSCQWASETRQQADSQLNDFLGSGAGMLKLYIDQ